MSTSQNSGMQRTTVRLDQHLMLEVKAFAVRRRTTITAVIEDALRNHLLRVAPSKLPISKQPKFPTFKGNGLQPGIKSWADVKRILEEEDIAKFKRVMRQNAVARR